MAKLLNDPSRQSTHHLRLAIARTFAVDATTGNLTDLQLMAAGREAKGHGIYIDERTLETALEAIDARGGRLKAYVTHNHAGPCSWDSPDMDEASSELNIPGFFSAIKIAKAQLIAGQFEFYEAFKKNFAPQYEQLLEMAKKTPDLLGISCEIWGYVVYVGKDGTEYSGEPADVELLYNGLPALRVTDMWAAAFVSDGAATDGLFARLSTRFARVFGGKQDAAARKEIAAALAQFAAEYAAGAEGEVLTPALNEPEKFSVMKIITDLQAKYAGKENESKLAAAMAIVGKTPADKFASLTVGDVEAQLAAQETQHTIATLTTERDTARTQVASLTSERDAARTEAATLKTERDSWKAKFEGVKVSGKGGPVDLGAESAGSAGDEPNPWAKASINRTRQAEILKTDPERAKALKAAAQK
jgi:hypothetical protein